MRSAPTTLPRRNVFSTLAPGAAARISLNAAMVAAVDSARLARPTTTTTLPFASCAATSADASVCCTTEAWVPGSYPTCFQA